MAKKKKRNLKPGDVLYPIFLTPDMHIHISKGNEKVGQDIYCLNLLPGADHLVLSDGTVLTNVKGSCTGCSQYCENDCYAIRDGKRHHNSCIIPWAENTLLVRYKLDVFLAEFVEYCKRMLVPFIRVHSAGEFMTYEHFKKFADTMRDNPWIYLAYAYTKREKWVNKYIKENHLEEYVRKFHRIYQNFVVLISRWNEWRENKYGCPIFVYDDGSNPDLNRRPHCPAVNKDGTKTGMTCQVCKGCPNGISRCVYDHSAKAIAKVNAAKAKAKKFTETHPFPKE